MVACEACGGAGIGKCGQERGSARADGECVVTGYTHMQTHTHNTDKHAQRAKEGEKKEGEREKTLSFSNLFKDSP